MPNKKLILVSILLLGLSLTGLKAQEAISATGGEAAGSGGSVSYSIGQMVYTINSGTNGSVAHGVQQPYEISVVNGIEEASRINVICSAYPNPATDYLILEIEGEVQTQYNATLYHMNGKLVETIKIISNETSIDMSNLVSGTYFLKVTNNQKEVKIFKIVKY